MRSRVASPRSSAWRRCWAREPARVSEPTGTGTHHPPYTSNAYPPPRRRSPTEDTMRTPASIAGHPIHPMLVPVAIGGLLLSFVFDIVCLATGTREPWATVAYYTMVGGIVGALVAAVFGFVDMLSLPSGYTKRIALTHMSINLFVVVLYICN